MAARLVIELDGSQHNTDANRLRDERRTRWLESEGFRVIRFWNNDSSNMDGVLETVYAALYGSRDARAFTAEAQSSPPSPHPGALCAPTLPLQGRVRNARFCLSCSPRKFRAHAGAGGGGFAQACDRSSGRCGVVYEGARVFVTPRRLALSVHGVPARQADAREEKKGPRVGAPENAIAGFLKAAGLKSIGEAKVQPDKKGEFYVAVIEKPGNLGAIEVIGEILPDVIGEISLAEIHALGGGSKVPGAFGWVRPLLDRGDLGPETEDPDIVPFPVVASRRVTRRAAIAFLRPSRSRWAGLPTINRTQQAKMVLDAERRRDIILAEAKQLAFAQGLELIEDDD